MLQWEGSKWSPKHGSSAKRGRWNVTLTQQIFKNNVALEWVALVWHIFGDIDDIGSD